MITVNDITQALRDIFPDREVCFDLTDVPQNITLPRGWEKFGLSLETVPAYPDDWNSFAHEFPTTIALLKNCLLGTALLIDDEVEMVYVFHDGNSFYYYVGGTPTEVDVLNAMKSKHLPGRLQDFYREVHNGYTYFPTRSMGPQRLNEQSLVSDLVDDEDDSFAKNWITLFSNGGGDYVAVEAGNNDNTEGLIWWHEEPATPELGIDIFEIMDAWMAIFLEDTKPRKELILKLT